MIAVKANKEYRVTEENKQVYLNDGYDILDDEGKVIEHSPKKTIKYSEYEKVKKELEEVKANADDGKTAELTAEVEKLTAEKVELTKANEKLAKEVEKLTKEVEKAKANN